MIEAIKMMLKIEGLGDTKTTMVLRGMYKIPTSFSDIMNQLKYLRYVN